MYGMDSDQIAINMGASSPLDHDQDQPSVPTDVESFPLYRQSSIYSLTLDEFQHAVCEPGKNFGSMNMDEFLTNIWTAEENQALMSVAINNAASTSHPHHVHTNNNPHPENITKNVNLSRQSSLHRQASVTLPAPLCRKTVEEVWSEIHRHDQQGGHEQQGNAAGANTAPAGSATGTTRQPTFGEMTLEDFLIKAGVVREGSTTHRGPQLQQQQQQPQQQQQQQQYGPNGSYGMVGYQISGEGSNSGGGVGRISGGTTNTTGPSGGGIVGFGGLHLEMGMGSPTGAMAPVAPPPPHEQYKSDVEGMRNNGWRKQGLDSPVEKVVERRQRRMIKNRESAARSRARKQASHLSYSKAH